MGEREPLPNGWELACAIDLALKRGESLHHLHQPDASSKIAYLLKDDDVSRAEVDFLRRFEGRRDYNGETLYKDYTDWQNEGRENGNDAIARSDILHLRDTSFAIKIFYQDDFFHDMSNKDFARYISQWAVIDESVLDAVRKSNATDLSRLNDR